MSVPSGFSAPFLTHDHYFRDEVLAHRAKVFAALSEHSDPALREIGRLLAGGTVSPHQLLDDPRHAETLRRSAQKLNELDPEQLRQRVFGPSSQPGDSAAGRAGTGHPTRPGTASPNEPGAANPTECGAARLNETGPASRSDHTDPDNGAGGVPAIRR